MTSDAEVARNTSVRDAIASLTAPGGPYEMRTEIIGGLRQRVWAQSPVNLRRVLEASAQYGDRTFLVLGEDRWTFTRHIDAVSALAHHLVEDLAIVPGDRVAIAMRNRPEWSVAFWASVSIGAIAVPLNGWWLGHELGFGLADSGARVLVADEERAERLRGHLPDSVEHVIVTGAIFDEVITGHASGDLPPASIEPDDDATLLYTSGTTGRAKGVIGTHRNMVSSLLSRRFFRDVHDSMRAGESPPDQTAQTAQTAQTDRRPAQPALPPVTLLTVPLFHVTGSHSYLLTALAGGATLVLMNRWDVHQALDLVATERVTSLGGVPFMALQLAEAYDPERHDLSSLATLNVGGAASPPAMAPLLAQLLPHVTLGNGYGMTETSAVAVFNHGPDLVARPDSLGRVVPVMDAMVMDEHDAPVPNGTPGELWMRGPNVVRGYWNRPEETAAAFAGDGWIRTGDIVTLDDDGFLTLVDRRKEIIVRGGENIAPAEVQAALLAHPDVLDVAVVPIPHPTLGEQVAALVASRPGSGLRPEAVIAFARTNLAAFKVPSVVVLTDMSIPRSPQGKLVRSTIASIVIDHVDRQIARQAEQRRP